MLEKEGYFLVQLRHEVQDFDQDFQLHYEYQVATVDFQNELQNLFHPLKQKYLKYTFLGLKFELKFD